jgi:pimeloyl-ACP methyl ester carboxylesterase
MKDKKQSSFRRGAVMDLCQAGQLALLAEGSHWVHLEEPARVNAFIGTFVRDGRG